MNSGSKILLAFVTSAIFFVGTGIPTNVWAAVIQCTEDDCFGTEENDIMKGKPDGFNHMFGFRW